MTDDNPVHRKVDSAILESVKETPAPANQIARQTGEHVTLVARRYHILGFEFTDGRWVWRGTKRTKASHE